MLVMDFTILHFVIMVTCVYSILPASNRTDWEISSSFQSRLDQSSISKEGIVAKTILSSIDRFNKPCDNFYQHVCGGHSFKKKDGFSMKTKNLILKELKSFIAANSLTNTFLQSCLGQNIYEPTVTEIIQQKIREIENSSNVSSIMALVGSIARETGVNSFLHNMNLYPKIRDGHLKNFLFFDFGIDVNTKSKKLALDILKNDRILSLEEIEFDTHSNYIPFLLTLKKMTPFEELNGNEDSSKCGSIYSVGDVIGFYPNTIGPMLRETFRERENLDELLLHTKINFAKLNSLDHFLKTADLSKVIYVVKYAIATSVATTYLQNGYGTSTMNQRESKCQDLVTIYFFDIILEAYVRRNYHPHILTAYKTMWNNIIEEANLQLNDDDSLLDKATRMDFAEKINAIKFFIQGEKDSDDNPVWNRKERLHSINVKLNVTNSFFTNLMIVKRVKHKVIGEEIGRIRDLSDMTGFINVAVYYIPNFNAAVVLASLLHYPMIGNQYPLILQYSIIGTNLAKSLMQSIGIKGIHYNKLGIKRNDGYTRFQANTRLFNQAKCYDDFYRGLHINKNNLRFLGNENGEKILDNYISNSGLQLAFAAYMKTGETINIPGYTPEKIFFLAYARSYCIAGNEPSNYDLNVILKFPQCPLELQINGNLMQNSDFAKAFNCPAHSYMNPVQKCNWWGKI